MDVTRRFVALSVVTLAACGRPPAGADPVAMVERLYDPYVAKKNTPDLINAAPWTGELRALIVRAERRQATTHRAIIEFDPIADGSDWEISALHVTLTKPPSNGRAEVAARFVNLGDQTVVNYALKHERDGWRVDNISADNWTLRQQFANAGITPETRDPS